MRCKLAVTVVILALIAGCAKVPQEAIDNASAAFYEARLSGAETFAPGSFAEAERVSALLVEELAVQEDRSNLRRSYDKAENLAAQLAGLANEAIAYAAAAKRNLTAQLESESEAVSAALRESEANFDLAKNKRGVRIDEENIASQIERVKSIVSTATADIAAEKLGVASSKLQEASFILESVNAVVDAALLTTSRR